MDLNFNLNIQLMSVSTTTKKPIK